METESTTRYTFDSFVVGSGNQSAHDAAQQVVQRSGKIEKPVVFCGGTGTGKTHLMHAIIHEMKQRSPEHSIIYSNPEKFTIEKISSITHNKMVYFRDRFSGVDLLLIDDIQFLAGKERAQQAFVQVVGELLRRGKQIVAGGSRSSEEFVSLAGELDLSLDSWLVVEIGPTDFETKLAILRKKSAKASITLTEDCLQFVAVNSNDVRELDGALTSLAAYSSLMGAEINLQTAQRVLAG